MSELGYSEMDMETRQPRSSRLDRLLEQHSPIAAAVAILALAVPLLLVPWSPSDEPGPSGASPGASASSPGSSPSAGPSATPGEPWESLSLEPFAEVATFAADASDAAGVRPEARFVLGSLTTEPAAELAKRLEVQPSATLRVAPGADESHVMLAPAAPLTAGQVYRVALRGIDGELTASWAFRVRGPLLVLGTLPGDRTTRVPVNTGIEVTFDQEDAADIGPYFSIEPTAVGRFDRHGRTQVFVPSNLLPNTLYTVTIRAGLPRTGTDLALEDDLVFRFETDGPRPVGQRWVAGRDVVEASPAEAPVIGIVAPSSVDAKGADIPIPATAVVNVYRFPSEEAALTALGSFLGGTRWSEFNGPTLPIADLQKALSFDAALEVLPTPWDEESNHRLVRFPSPLDEGWYAIEIAGVWPAHIFLQVTRVSAWVSILTDKTVVWVNDVVTHRPIAGATASLPGSNVFGTSAADGILNAATPSGLLPAAVAEGEPAALPIVVVRSGPDTLLLPFDVGFEPWIYRGEWWEEWAPADETYWSLLSTDRVDYRTTDNVALWGLLRGRDGDAVPDHVDVRVVSQSSQGLEQAPAIASATFEPDALGLFSGRLPLDLAPLGYYIVEAVVDGRVVASTSIQVTVIRKPEYQLAVALDHLAAFTGTSVGITATATFFDGTPVSGLPLRLSSGGAADSTLPPTDASGTTSIRVPATIAEGYDDSSSQWLAVWPAGPESGDIQASTSLLVFAASEHIGASGAVAQGRVRVTGTLRSIDLASVERELAAEGWSGDPGGPPVAGRSIRFTVTELVPVRTQIGTRYDFIEKVVIPLFRYEIERREVRTATLTSGADGGFAIDVAVPDPKHEYEVRFSAQDRSGRSVLRTIMVGTAFEEPRVTDDVDFRASDGGSIGDATFAVGDPIRWTMTANETPLPAGGSNRYLYIVAQRGLVSVTTTDSPTFERTFRDSDAPGVFVMGIRFTGTTYAPKAAAWADLDKETRRIRVAVTADRERYQPGDDITLRVRTVDSDGRPVAANLVLQAVDEKLYAAGAAFTADPLSRLYGRVDSGIVRLGASHQVPTAAGGEGEGGSEGGGGPRTDFRDMLVFLRLSTNADGIATTTFRASDDLTSWHVAAYALTADLEAGVGEALIPVGLPLFASVTIADQYLLADRPSIRLRAFGLDMRAGDRVVFTVASPTLGSTPVTIESTAFADVWVDLPPLRLGRQTVDVAVTAPNRKDASGTPLTDRLITAFEVVETRLSVAKAGYGVVGGAQPVVPDDVAAQYVFTDAGRGRYLPLLLDLVGTSSVRLDRGLASTMARAMLEGDFGRDLATLPPDAFDPEQYPLDSPGPTIDDWTAIGVALVPYGGPDPWLSTRVAISDPDSGVARNLLRTFIAIRDQASLPRDLRVAAVAALAALGEPVFADVAELRDVTDLTPFERIHVGLAAAALGDDATARAIVRALLEEYGERLGPWVRLGTDSERDDVAEMTALLALLAARVGDPLAPAMLDYVSTHPSAETSHALEAAATIAALLERTPAARASFAYTVDGSRSVVDIPSGGAVTIALTVSQRATLVLEKISGEVGMVVTWRENTDIASLHLNPTISLARTTPTTVPVDGLVVVNVVASFTSSALHSGCYTVLEQVPSGLAPLSWRIGQDDMPASGAHVVWPSRIVGQEVSFCVPWVPLTSGPVTLRYVARVVSAGTFTWEPAVMTLDGAPDVVTVTGASSLRIGE